MKALEIILDENLIERFKSNILEPIFTSCMLWLGPKDVKGYGAVFFRRNGKFIKYFAHRISYHLSNGPVPTDKCVCHSCDNPLCVNPNHLWLGTLSENSMDRVRKGRSFKATSAMPHAILNEAMAIAILKDPRPQKSIAKEYSISRENVGSIKLGKTWKYLPRNLLVKPGPRSNRKLTPESVLRIRSDPRSYSEISKSFGIAASHVLKIKKHRKWKHLPW
jgi:hypothetical protein